MTWRFIGFVSGMMTLVSPAAANPSHHGLAHSPDENTTVPRAAQRVLKMLDQNGLLADLQPPLREQTACLALVLYQEARGQSSIERVAVAQVVFNRMLITGQSICSTIWAHSGSQFQWVKRPLHDILPHETRIWDDLRYLAIALIKRRPPDITQGATSFYNPRLCKPNWARSGRVTLRFQNVFLRMAHHF